MKRAMFVPFGSLLIAAAFAGCTDEASETFGSGGGGASSAGGPVSAGSSAVSGAGGSALAAGGATAGTSVSGGVAGALAGAGGGAAGTGGAATAGSAGSAGGGAGPCETVECVAGIKNQYQDALTSAFMLFGCYASAGQDCITNPSGTACPNQNGNLPFEEQGISTTQKFEIGGVAGKTYALSITVNGIVEAKYYSGGTRAAGNADPPNPDAENGIDTFYTGGIPVDFENYNVYKLVSKDAQGKELEHYYLNSFPQTNTPYENHRTFPIAFTHDVKVVGGGSVTLLAADRNCHAIDNCGPGFRTTSCPQTDGRKVPNEPNLMVPTSYVGTAVASMNLRGGATQPYHSQILHLVAHAVSAP
jgi:hypothetical protein